MKRKAVLILLLLFLPLYLYTQEDLSGQSMELVSEAQEYFYANSPLSEGSDAETAGFNFIQSRLDSQDIPYRYQTLDKLESGHSFSKNLIATIKGKTQDQLILIVPVHNPPGQGLNTAIALGFLNEWSLTVPPLSLTVLFTSADSRQDYPLGSLNFLEDFSFDNLSAVIYYKPESPAASVELKGSVTSYTAPGWLMETVLHAAEENSVPVYINIPDILINKSGINVEITPISPYLSEEIPAVYIGSSDDGKEYGDNSRFIRNQLKMLKRIVREMDEGIPDEWERNYLYAHIPGGEYVYLSEKRLIQIFLLFFALGILIPLVQERRVYLNIRKFRHQLWTIPVLVYLTFQFFMLSTLIIEEILVYRNQSELVAQYPLIFFLFKTSIVMFLSRIMLNILRGLAIPQKSPFLLLSGFCLRADQRSLWYISEYHLQPVLSLDHGLYHLFCYRKRERVQRLFLIFISAADSNCPDLYFQEILPAGLQLLSPLSLKREYGSDNTDPALYRYDNQSQLLSSPL